MKTFIVTGANSGLGLETTRALAATGARIIMACRDTKKGEAVAPSGGEVRALDLASLASVRAFAKDLREKIDGVVNNAGVMAIPRATTRDGFEMQFGTNHLGHFALTALLWPQLKDDARIVTVSSLMHHAGVMRFSDLQGEIVYQKWLAYGQSKLANLLFAFELARRIRAASGKQMSLAAHPGYANTNLTHAGLAGSRVRRAIFMLGDNVLAQNATHGAAPTIFAATSPDAQSGEFFGPSGPFELRGRPKRVEAARRAHHRKTAERLWRVSEELTGVRFKL